MFSKLRQIILYTLIQYVYYYLTMKVHNFQGDLAGVSAWTISLSSRPVILFLYLNQILFEYPDPINIYFHNKNN